MGAESMSNIDKLVAEATIRIQVGPEDSAVHGNAMASGDDVLDKKVADDIIAELEAGNEWAWCQVIVSAHAGSFSGVDSLGCCSYGSESEFTQPGNDYYDDMILNAREDLRQELTTALKLLTGTK